MKEEELIRYVSDGFDKAKQGEAIGTYETILPWLTSGILPAKSHYPFGWIIYYALHQSAAHDIMNRKRMLANYLKLHVVRPHKLHSMILTEAIRLYKDAKDSAFNKKREGVTSFSIVRFTGLWNLANLRPGDWRRKEYGGKPQSSTVEKLITVCIDEIEEKRLMPPEEFVGIVDKALHDNPGSTALLSQRAVLYAMEAEMDNARALLRNALVIAPGKFYLWTRLASLVVRHDNPRLYMALLYKALRAPGQEQYKGRIRLSLAMGWLERGMAAQARWELDKVRRLYEDNGWHLPKDFMAADSRIPSGTQAENPEILYRKFEPLADEEIYAALPEIRVVKNYHKNPDPDAAPTGYGRPAVAWRVVAEDGSNYWLQPHRFGIDPALPVGTPLLIRLYNGKPVRAGLTD